jgi:hypothetical protein
VGRGAGGAGHRQPPQPRLLPHRHRGLRQERCVVGMVAYCPSPMLMHSFLYAVPSHLVCGKSGASWLTGLVPLASHVGLRFYV